MILFAIFKACGINNFELEAMHNLEEASPSWALCFQRGPLAMRRDEWEFYLGFVRVYYVMARVILVVGCLIALFNSVPGVFEEPSWSAYFPHIT